MKIIFLFALIAMLITYPMYFVSLISLKRVIVDENESIWRNAKRLSSMTDFQVAYRILKLSKTGEFQGEILSTRIMAARKSAVRLLYLCITLFMVALFSGLIDSLTYRLPS